LLLTSSHTMHSFPAGITKLNWLVDFEGYSMMNAPPAKTSLETLHILQNHYPERLGAAICYHAPRIFSITWMVSAWLHPLTALQQAPAIAC
jgi:hypothetical protein